MRYRSAMPHVAFLLLLACDCFMVIDACSSIVFPVFPSCVLPHVLSSTLQACHRLHLMVSFSDVAVSLRKVSRRKVIVRHGAEPLVGGLEKCRLSFLSTPLPRIVLDLGTRSLVGGVVL